MKKLMTAIVTLLCSASLMSCSNMSNQDVGVMTGALAGGLLGSTIGGGSGQALAIAAGAMAGAIIGGSIGKNMDENDRARMCACLENNPSGQPAYWRNSHSGAAYTVVPVRNVCVGQNEYCREYRTTAMIAGKKQQMYGTACRRPDGTWEAVS